MPVIEIISSSVRTGRNSHRVARYLKQYITENAIGHAAIIDLNEYCFPLFEERLKYMDKPGEKVLSFASRIRNADGVIIVTPEYNGGYPASLKNAIDLLYDEWQNKPIALSTVSTGAYAGTQVSMQLQFVLWKIGAIVVPATFAVAKVTESYDEDGNALEKDKADKFAARFLGKLTWQINANNKMQ